MKIKAPTILNSQNRLFWLCVSTTTLLLVVYMVLIQSTIYNVVVEKRLSNEVKSITDSLLVLEEEYMTRSSEISLSSIGNFALEEMARNEVHYVRADSDKNLTLLRNANQR